MLQELSKITGFDPKNFTKSSIIQEAAKKFNYTYLVINGKCQLVKDIISSGIDADDFYRPEDIESIEIWMPKAGIYQYNLNHYLYLYRLPRRQWLKSLSLESNYSIICLHENAVDDLRMGDVYNLSKLSTPVIDSTRQWLIYKNKVMFKTHIVAELANNKWGTIMRVTDPMFYQEVLDKWKKQYPITLA